MATHTQATGSGVENLCDNEVQIQDCGGGWYQSVSLISNQAKWKIYGCCDNTKTVSIKLSRGDRASHQPVEHNLANDHKEVSWLFHKYWKIVKLYSL